MLPDKVFALTGHRSPVRWEVFRTVVSPCERAWGFLYGFLEAKDLSDLDWIDGRWFRGVGRKRVVFFKLKLKPVMWISISLCLQSLSEVISLLFVVFGFYPWHFHRVTAHLERGTHSEEPYFSPFLLRQRALHTSGKSPESVFFMMILSRWILAFI